MKGGGFLSDFENNRNNGPFVFTDWSHNWLQINNERYHEMQMKPTKSR